MSENKKELKELPIKIREANQEDVGFIFNSWLKSYRNSHFAKNIPNITYFSEHHKIIENLLRNNTVIIACNSEDESQIYGYSCAGMNDGVFTLHYIYVKHNFRNMGIGSALLSSLNYDTQTAGVYTHHTRVVEKISSKYNMIYHPYLLFNNNSK